MCEEGELGKILHRNLIQDVGHRSGKRRDGCLVGLSGGYYCSLNETDPSEKHFATTTIHLFFFLFKLLHPMLLLYTLKRKR